MYKEYKLPKESFIGGWFIPTNVCNELISYYNEFNMHASPGKVKNNYSNKSIKDSIELAITVHNQDKEIIKYQKCLQQVLNLYMKKYPEVDKCEKFKFADANIQKYPKKGGFKKWHHERTLSLYSKRLLVFMTYLNNIVNGGTIFKYQKITTPSKKGLTLIWPPDFTHTHKGQIVDKEKMIITGWFELV